MKRIICAIFFFLLHVGTTAGAENVVRIGGKTFTESYILAELFAAKLSQAYPGEELAIEIKLGLGGTAILFSALTKGEVDLYPEYTGTLAEALLKNPKLTEVTRIRRALDPMGLTISAPLGFNNSYALAMRRKQAQARNIQRISDLRKHPDIRARFSYEFLRRSDGYDALAQHYDLHLPDVKGMEHSLTYPAIESGAIDLMDVYTTDAKIKTLDLAILTDDLEFFPRYDSVIIARKDFIATYPRGWAALRRLEGRIHPAQMIDMNALVDLEDKTFKEAAWSFLQSGETKETSLDLSRNLGAELWQRTKEHLFLVVISLLASILVGIPLGILATRSRMLAQVVLSVSSIVQTIPSLALLCFFIPFLGIGVVPALAALFLYGLLPIVRNTFSGIQASDARLLEICHVIGLSGFQRIRWVELPLASRSILAGVKTSVVINVGTATLAAFIGAGGLGSFIVTGLALNNIPVILQGAVPAALLALLLQGLFEWSDKLFIPRGLRM